MGVSGFGRLPGPEWQTGEETILRGAPDRPPEASQVSQAPEVPGPPDAPEAPDAPDAPEAPIYAELARRWQAEGRAVPGLPDPVWESLAAPAGAQSAVSGSGRRPLEGPAWGSPWSSERNPAAGSGWNPG